MKKVCIHFATGFEETEAITTVDVLKRAGIEVIMVSITNNKIVEGAHQVSVVCDKLFTETNYSDIDMIILPGGMPGSNNLEAHIGLKAKIQEFYNSGKKLSAICAAPLVFGKMGLLKGQKAVCYPGFEKYLEGAAIQKDAVIESGNFITANGPGAAIKFGLKIVEKLINKETADKVKAGMLAD